VAANERGHQDSDSALGIQRSDLTALTLLSSLPPRLFRVLRHYTEHSTAAETCQSTITALPCSPLRTAIAQHPAIGRCSQKYSIGYWPMLIGFEYVRDLTTVLPRAGMVLLDGTTVARRRLLRTHKHGPCAVFIRSYIALGYNIVPTYTWCYPKVPEI
jgi:hypothetical protein